MKAILIPSEEELEPQWIDHNDEYRDLHFFDDLVDDYVAMCDWVFPNGPMVLAGNYDIACLQENVTPPDWIFYEDNETAQRLGADEEVDEAVSNAQVRGMLKGNLVIIGWNRESNRIRSLTEDEIRQVMHVFGAPDLVEALHDLQRKEDPVRNYKTARAKLSGERWKQMTLILDALIDLDVWAYIAEGEDDFTNHCMLNEKFDLSWDEARLIAEVQVNGYAVYIIISFGLFAEDTVSGRMHFLKDAISLDLVKVKPSELMDVGFGFGALKNDLYHQSFLRRFGCAEYEKEAVWALDSGYRLPLSAEQAAAFATEILEKAQNLLAEGEPYTEPDSYQTERGVERKVRQP